MDNKHGNPIRVAFRKLFQNKLATDRKSVV